VRSLIAVVVLVAIELAAYPADTDAGGRESRCARD
jgi:hypothetical protein